MGRWEVVGYVLMGGIGGLGGRLGVGLNRRRRGVEQRHRYVVWSLEGEVRALV